MVQATSELTGFPVELTLFNGYGPTGPYDGMYDSRWFTDLDEPAFRALIAEVPELTIDRIDVMSDVSPGRSDEKWLNAWCVRAQTTSC